MYNFSLPLYTYTHKLDRCMHLRRYTELSDVESSMSRVGRLDAHRRAGSVRPVKLRQARSEAAESNAGGGPVRRSA